MISTFKLLHQFQMSNMITTVSADAAQGVVTARKSTSQSVVPTIKLIPITALLVATTSAMIQVSTNTGTHVMWENHSCNTNIYLMLEFCRIHSLLEAVDTI